MEDDSGVLHEQLRESCYQDIGWKNPQCTEDRCTDFARCQYITASQDICPECENHEQGQYYETVNGDEFECKMCGWKHTWHEVL